MQHLAGRSCILLCLPAQMPNSRVHMGSLATAHDCSTTDYKFWLPLILLTHGVTLPGLTTSSLGAEISQTLHTPWH
jgi:hypothetical protein